MHKVDKEKSLKEFYTKFIIENLLQISEAELEREIRSRNPAIKKFKELKQGQSILIPEFAPPLRALASEDIQKIKELIDPQNNGPWSFRSLVAVSGTSLESTNKLNSKSIDLRSEQNIGVGVSLDIPLKPFLSTRVDLYVERHDYANLTGVSIEDQKGFYLTFGSHGIWKLGSGWDLTTGFLLKQRPYISEQSGTQLSIKAISQPTMHFALAKGLVLGKSTYGLEFQTELLGSSFSDSYTAKPAITYAVALSYQRNNGNYPWQIKLGYRYEDLETSLSHQKITGLGLSLGLLWEF